MNRSGIAAGVIIAASIAAAAGQAPKPDPSKFLTQPLVKDLYTADPSAHVFNGKLFIYPSHDIDAGVPADDLGSHFAMRDYHVFSMDAVGGKVTDHGVALDIRNVPWAGRQMWAPDAAEKGGKYYLYFPVKDREDVFRIGAAVGNSPAGPFTSQAEPIKGSYSIDPAVFKDTDGKYYMYFGGIWGGQLQRWASGTYTPKDTYPAKDQPALSAKIARLGDDMVSFAEAPKDVVLLDEKGKAAQRRGQWPPLLRSGLAAQAQRHVLLLVLDRRHALHHVCDRHVAVRSVHRQGQDPRAGARLDESPLDRRVPGEVVPLLSRRAALGRPDAPAQHQDDRAAVPPGWFDHPDRCLHRVKGGAQTASTQSPPLRAGARCSRGAGSLW